MSRAWSHRRRVTLPWTGRGATGSRALPLWLALVLAPLAAGPAPGQPPADADAAASPAPAERPFEYLWVVRTALLTPASAESVVARASAMGARGLLVQAVGRGDAYYRSDLLPRPEPLALDGFDPLGHLLPLAHAAGLEVHAWVNCMLVWSGPRPPRDPRHVVNAHPEWVARLRDGRRMSDVSAAQRARLGVEGVFLAPGHPAVRTWMARVAGEVAARYPVDGVHLDYIRQPGVDTGYDPTTRARFAMAHGADPARFAGLPPAERARLDSLWRAFQAEQVTAAVREVRDTLARARPGLALTAAVLADTGAARGPYAQPWGDWLEARLLDRVFVMCYAPEVQTVLDQLVGLAGRHGLTERVVPGIAVYNTSPSLAAAKLKGARTLGFPALALYSYDSLTARPGYWPRLRDGLAARAAGP
jgi:uncharacterized lipoprotein YddW (UPF0748 family)